MVAPCKDSLPIQTRKTGVIISVAEREGIRTPGWLPTAAGVPAAALANGDLSVILQTL